MIQQINLFQDIDQATVSRKLNVYLLSLPLLCIVLAGFSLFSWWSVSRQQHQLQQLQSQLQTATARLQLLQQQNTAEQPDQLLEHKLQQTKNAEHILSEVLKNLTDNTSDQTRGFSRYFSALAKQADGSIWLNRIYINAENSTLLLQGSSFAAANIPYFIQRLKNEAVFKGRSFAHLTLKEATQNSRQIDFTVRSSLEKTDEINP